MKFIISKKIEKRCNSSKSLTIDEFLTYMKELRSVIKSLNLLPSLRKLNKTSQNKNFRVESFYYDPNLLLLFNTLSMFKYMPLGSIPHIATPISMYNLLTGKDFFTHRSLVWGERLVSTMEFILSSNENWKIASKELISVKSNSIDSIKVSEISLIALKSLVIDPIFKNPTIAFNFNFVRGKNILDDWIANILENKTH